MNRRDRIWALVTCAAFAFLGGVFSNWVFSLKTVHAQQTTKTIATQKLEVVDKDGNVKATLTAEDVEPSLELRSPVRSVVLGSNGLSVRDGSNRPRAGVNMMDSFKVHIWLADTNGKIVWEAKNP